MKTHRAKKLQIDGWEEEILGLWLAENEHWLLMRRLHDYRTDGYVLVAKRFITNETPEKNLAQTARVLKLKGISAQVPTGFVFGTVVEMLQYIERTYKLFQFQDEEDTSFCGQLRDYDATHYRINSLSPRAEFDLDYDLWFLSDDLIIIEFDNDYLASLHLLWQDKARRRWKINQRNQSN